MPYMTQVIKCKRLNNQKYYQTQKLLTHNTYRCIFRIQSKIFKKIILDVKQSCKYTYNILFQSFL